MTASGSNAKENSGSSSSNLNGKGKAKEEEEYEFFDDDDDDGANEDDRGDRGTLGRMKDRVRRRLAKRNGDGRVVDEDLSSWISEFPNLIERRKLRTGERMLIISAFMSSFFFHSSLRYVESWMRQSQ